MGESNLKCSQLPIRLMTEKFSEHEPKFKRRFPRLSRRQNYQLRACLATVERPSLRDSGQGTQGFQPTPPNRSALLEWHEDRANFPNGLRLQSCGGRNVT